MPTAPNRAQHEAEPTDRSTPADPATGGINIAEIPAELKPLPRWVVWRYELDEDGRPTKVPYRPSDPTRRASSTDPKSWSDFETALAVVARGGADGIGFVLGAGIVGIDLDKCVDPITGTLETWAREIVETVSSYTESSPSGRGIHLLAIGSLPPRGRKKGPVEMYESARFFTMTGNRVPGTPATIEDRTDALQRVHEKVFGVRGAKASSKSTHKQRGAPERDNAAGQSDRDLLDRAKSAKNGQKFTRLWGGDWTDYPSQSEADLALCQMLAFWTNGDDARIDSLFRRSGLMREKWDEKHFSGGETYGEHTVALAVENLSTAASAVTPDPLDRTDLGNATRFAAKYPDVRYDHVRRHWYIFRDGLWWVVDAVGEVYELAKGVIRARMSEVTRGIGPEEAAQFLKWAIRSAQRERIAAMLALAQYVPTIADTGTGWNPDPLLLGVANGVVDLRTGQLRAGLPDDRITKSVSVAFSASTACPRWERFLLEVFGGNHDLVRYMQRALGYSITGQTSEQVLFINFGEGANGKSTLFNAVHSVVGGYALNLPFTALEKGRSASIPNDLATLPGARFVTASETNEGTRLNEGLIKALTGCDPITARFLYGEFFTFIPVAKYWLAVNHKPVVQDTSHGFWRRIHLIPYTQQFPRDERLAGQLLAEREGILRWLVEGALLWQRDGLNPPESVQVATRTYKEESDLVTQFVEERCLRDTSSTVQASFLYRAFVEWCETQGYDSKSPEWLGSKAFGTRVSGILPKHHTRAGWVYDGLRLVVGIAPDDDPVAGFD